MNETARASGRARSRAAPPRMMHRGRSTPASRRIAVVPAYNEEPTVRQVLARLAAHPAVDEIVIVDDGSTDRTKAEIEAYIATHPDEPIQFVSFPENRGMSAAYYEAFQAIGTRVRAGELSPDDLILTVDADGQHDPDLLDRLIAIVMEEDLAALVAERDLLGSGYTRYKRLGNWVMSAWGSLWAGQRWNDIESGFRIFRAGPLLEALRYYRGWKYSETVEVAVILCRLGYKVRNDVRIPVPVFRSRTRLFDVAVDLWAMPAAWYRVTVGRHAPPAVAAGTAYWLPLLVFVPLALVLLLVLEKSIFLGTDSINNYIHVWYLKDRVIDHAAFPFHAAPLDNGAAVALPYGAVPWLAGALLWVVLSEWSVTLMFVVGLVGLIWAAVIARPVMRDPWLLALFVLNPFYSDAIFSFQYSFVWSGVCFFLFVAALDRQRWVWAGLLGWLAMSTHPIMGVPPVALYLAWSVWRGRTPLPPAAALSAVMGLALLPVLYLTLATPAVGDNDARTIILSVADVVVRRGTILLVPLVFDPLQGMIRRYWLPLTGVVVAGLVVNTVMANGFLGFAQGSYTGIVRTSRDYYAPFARSDAFVPGAHFRVLAPNEREDGLYYLVRHGAVLTSELFTESMFKRSFTEQQYACFLRAEDVDFVVVERAYFAQYRTNEQSLLDGLAIAGLARRVYSEPGGRYTVYDVTAAREAASPEPRTVRGCLRATT